MEPMREPVLREQLLVKREKLESAIVTFDGRADLIRLLNEVDAALARVDNLTYGLCEVCHEAIETERLIADPLVQVCLGHLTAAQQSALEEDLELAAGIQRGLLPKQNHTAGGWETSYHYEPVGIVSGDYCDLIAAEESDLYFLVGDVSGKGVAASMLMSNLQAMFHTLISVGMPLKSLMERASRVFCESTLPTHYATLVVGRANSSGEVEIANAGHLPPLLLHEGEVTCIDATGLPVGMFCEEQFSVSKVQLSAGDVLLLYTDGLSEAQDLAGCEYGRERLARLLGKAHGSRPEILIRSCIDDLAAFRSGSPKTDDMTIMAIRRQ